MNLKKVFCDKNEKLIIKNNISVCSIENNGYLILDPTYDSSCFDICSHHHKIHIFWLKNFGEFDILLNKNMVPVHISFFEVDKQSFDSYLRKLEKLNNIQNVSISHLITKDNRVFDFFK